MAMQNPLKLYRTGATVLEGGPLRTFVAASDFWPDGEAAWSPLADAGCEWPPGTLETVVVDFGNRLLTG